MRSFLFFAVGCVALSAGAESLRFEGVLGNSGELDRPVTFGPPARGLGAAYDAARGVLFDRAGSGRLNAYALDGRLLAQYVLPAGQDPRDAMTLCGDTLVLLLGGQLYTLRTDAASGAAAAKLAAPVEAPDTLSSSARQGRVAVRAKSGRLYLLNPTDGRAEAFGEAPGESCNGMDWDERGDFFVLFGKEANKLVNGALVRDGVWPKRYAGDREAGIERATRIGAYWYGSTWHGTVKRFSSDFDPAPGVVLGGASGHFIGHVPCNYDVELARGLAQVAPGLFAVGGLYGVVQLAEWRPELSGLRLVRRIGALAPPGGLAVDAQGRILAGKNIWRWTDDALAPADVSHVFNLVAPCAWLDANTVVGLAEVYGKVSVAMGRFEEEELYCNRLDKLEVPRDVVGVAVYRERQGGLGGWRLLALGAKGQARVHEIAEDRRNPWRKDLGEARLDVQDGVEAYSDATMADADTLLAAADGCVVAFARNGVNWRESGRWSDGFGRRLRLAVNAGRIAVADAEKNRVALYALQGHRKLAEATVASPTALALNGVFLAVYDSAGQRIMKYRVEDGAAR